MTGARFTARSVAMLMLTMESQMPIMTLIRPKTTGEYNKVGAHSFVMAQPLGRPLMERPKLKALVLDRMLVESAFVSKIIM